MKKKKGEGESKMHAVRLGERYQVMIEALGAILQQHKRSPRPWNRGEVIRLALEVLAAKVMDDKAFRRLPPIDQPINPL